MPTIKSDAALLIEAGVNFPDNTTQLITPAALREMVEDLINSKINSSGFSGITGILEYTTDLAGLYTNRTLVDKEYVDLQLTAINEWGDINGDINDQVDLIALLNTKLNIDGTLAMTGNLQLGSNTITGVGEIVINNNARIGNVALTAYMEFGASGILAITGIPRFSNLTVSTVPYLNVTGDLTSSSITPTELGYLSGATSNLQNQINNINAGLSWKTAVRVATTANITLSGAQTIDGISVIAGDRVLVKNQSTSSQNGFYLCAAGSWTRTTDANTGATILQATVSIEEGTVNADTIYTCTTDAPITIGATSIVFAKTSATTYTSSDGVSLTGNNFTLDNSYFTGDITISAGVTTIGALKVTNSMLAGSIAYSKLSLTGSIVNGDLVNSSTTINGTLISLGASGIVTAAAGTLTGTTLNSTVVTSSLTSVGTIGTGTWQGTIIGSTYGGTGINNGSKTITLGGNLATTGAFNLTISVPQTTTYTLPNTASETLAGLGTAQTFSAIQTFADNILSSATTNTKDIGSTTNAWANVYSRIIRSDPSTGTNVVGNDLIAIAGQGTGNATANFFRIQTGTSSVTSGTTAQTLIQRASFGDIGGATGMLIHTGTLSSTNYTLSHAGFALTVRGSNGIMLQSGSFVNINGDAASTTIGSGAFSTYRTTNAGSNVVGHFAIAPANSATSGLLYSFSTADGMVFAQGNGTRQIAFGAIKGVSLTTTAGSEAGSLGFYTQAAGAAIALRFTIGATSLTIADAIDVAMGTTTGTKWGTSTAQKQSFWNATPIVQPSSANQAALTNSTTGTYDGTLVDVGIAFSQANINNNFTDLYTVVNEIRNVLVNTGLMKGSA